MSAATPSNAKQLKCPSCGAPVTSVPGRTAIYCEYCGSCILVPSQSQSRPPTTVIVETRHRDLHPRHLRRLLESADYVARETNDR